jgi:GNAT superfamily N-acetyltransferase
MWPTDKPVIDAVAPDKPFDAVTAALGAVGLGDVPAWLRPYHVLSNGERFRADLARIVAEAPGRVVIDEFSSVVDRQIAKVGAGAFAKSWRRTGGQAVLLSCHYDILDWVEPDWVYDTRDASFHNAPGYRRPRIDVEVRLGGWGLWPYFKPHHYLDSPPMPAAKVYVGFVDGEPVVHLGMSTRNVPVGKGKQGVEGRACRMVVLPEWQGAGLGMRFLNAICEMQRTGNGVLPGRRMTTLFHTSHPNLCAALRRDPRWRQVSAAMHGTRKAASAASIQKSARKAAAGKDSMSGHSTGYGGHMRAVQGFRYVGPPKES